MTFLYLQQAALGSPIERVEATSEGLQAFLDKGWALVSFATWLAGVAPDTKAAMELNAPAGQFNDPAFPGKFIDATTGEPVVAV